MDGMEFYAQQQLEHERHAVNVRIFRKLRLARRDGYLTDRDLIDLKHELGVHDDDCKPENAANQ